MRPAAPSAVDAHLATNSLPTILHEGRDISPSVDGHLIGPMIARRKSMAQSCIYRALNRGRLLAAVLIAAVAVASLPALAHHGWDWAQAEQTEMKGTVQKVSMAPPHPSLQVKAADGVVW